MHLHVPEEVGCEVGGHGGVEVGFGGEEGGRGDELVLVSSAGDEHYWGRKRVPYHYYIEE